MLVFKLSWLPYILILAGILLAAEGQYAALILTAIGVLWLIFKYKNKKAANNTSAPSGVPNSAPSAPRTPSAASNTAPSAATPTANANASAKPVENFCANCGAKVTPGSVFCSACGKKL